MNGGLNGARRRNHTKWICLGVFRLGFCQYLSGYIQTDNYVVNGFFFVSSEFWVLRSSPLGFGRLEANGGGMALAPRLSKTQLYQKIFFSLSQPSK